MKTYTINFTISRNSDEDNLKYASRVSFFVRDLFRMGRGWAGAPGIVVLQSELDIAEIQSTVSALISRDDFALILDITNSPTASFCGWLVESDSILNIIPILSPIDEKSIMS